MAGRAKIPRIIGLVLLWLVTILETLSMLAAGSGKFSNAAFWGRWFAEWGYPNWFMLFIGAAEMGGALLLLVPRTAPYGAAGLIVVMLGALFTVVMKESGNLTPGPVLFNLLALAIILWFRRPIWLRQGARGPTGEVDA